MFIYASGDTIAALIANEFLVSRMIGMIIIGAAIYSFEIPNYFAWIDKTAPRSASFSGGLKRTLLAILYFNPLWITRHVFFIALFSLNNSLMGWDLFRIGLISFTANLPVSFTANFFIQNKIQYGRRFTASAVFSAVMAVYYSLSGVIFK